MKKFAACCFTGHRPEKMGYSLQEPNPRKYALESRLAATVSGMAQKGVTTFYCGCARGFDLLAALSVLEYKKENSQIKLVCVIPFEDMGQSWTGHWKNTLEKVLSQSDETVVVSKIYTPWSYDERNRYMVDRSDAVITCWDGEKGGTENTLKYAKKKGIPILNISKDYAELPDENQNPQNYTAEQLPFCE